MSMLCRGSGGDDWNRAVAVMIDVDRNLFHLMVRTHSRFREFH